MFVFIILTDCFKNRKVSNWNPPQQLSDIFYVQRRPHNIFDS